MAQGIAYNVDIVMCIDCTASMGDLLETVKKNALKFYPDLVDRCQAKGKEISDLRIRVIGFRDFGYDSSNAILDTGFLPIPAEEEKFKSVINSFTPQGGGPEPESGLEVLSMAINSDWTKGGDRRRHVIVVWSDASTHDLKETGTDNPLYPVEIPDNFDQLTDWWEDEQGGKMNKSSKRLILFTPDAKSWTEIGNNWSNTIHHPAKAGLGLEEVDYETILSTIVNSI
ncbi:MAG: VWA domain-containing protein [Muribaculaceae bacterium]|nr:VWA domain-containing protein [Muribaculaceae bacterium]MDE6754359.1 VWA domain-containing protein [Muribaculaceae bacterium]